MACGNLHCPGFRKSVFQCVESSALKSGCPLWVVVGGVGRQTE